MRLLLFLISIGLLFAGCIGSGQSLPSTPSPNVTLPPVANTSPNATAPPPVTNQTCSEYCISQPHIECVGTWNISGTYPVCICGFVCDVVENNTPPVNDTPPEPLATPTNLTAMQLMENGLAQEKDDFYSSNDGSYIEKTYTWLRESSGGTFGGMAPASDVKFNGEAIPSILASGFVFFEDKDSGSKQAYGLAIFNQTHTFLDDFTGSDAFDVDYFPPIIDKKLRDCWVYSKDFNIDSHGDWLQTYYFKCERAPDK
ncbi:MAG: hypothetical protein V1861_01415 [Candidatus Micrarchaeota archaeon]